ncbi:MAG: amidinotransferase, partial [Planctomycetaceae bacterium]|nr:amidinotransferase [Planctomycetaceae bacterium]
MNLLPQILMCPPDYYGIEYEINPWMDTDRPADRHAAQHQWHGLRDLLEQLGARITLIDPVPGLPDLVFTANAALVHDDVAVMANFRYAQRQRETPINAQWFRTHGFRVEFLPEGLAFEGAGDALFCGDTLFAGYRIRSDMRSEQLIGEMLNCRVIALPLVDPYYYHLDTCFCPLAPGIALYYPGAFDHYGI